MLQIIYITVGIIAILSICVFALCNMFDWVCEKISSLRRTHYTLYTIRTFNELSLAFHQDKKLEAIFKRLADDAIWYRKLNVWDFRDLIEKEFGRE